MAQTIDETRPPVEGAGVISWTAAERQSFFDAITQHRRASWRVTAACVLAVTVLALVTALLLAPLLFCLAGLAVDVADLVVPAPDLLGTLAGTVDALVGGRITGVPALAGLGVVAALPGLALMGVALFALRRALRTSPLFDAGGAHGRAPDRSVLAEQRLANVVEEMSLAAELTPPRVQIVPGGANAAVFGRDQEHATLLIGAGLLDTLDRGQLQGAVAHLVGSVAGGDLPIGLRAALVFSLFGLMARIAGCVGDRGRLHAVTRLLRALMWPDAARTAYLVEELADPFRSTAPGPSVDTDPGPGEGADGALTWREWALMPLFGPVVLTGFLSGLVSTFLLGPLVASAWRQRKYMADAAAVRLTRDPDLLAGALDAIGAASGGTGLRGWASHMAVVSGDATELHGLVGGRIVPNFPSLERREKALQTLGAHVSPAASQRIPWWWLVPLVALLAAGGGLMASALYLLVLVSMALSGLFTVVPAALLHVLLRAIGR